MNTLHKQIYKALLPTLLEVTKATRDRLNPPKTTTPQVDMSNYQSVKHMAETLYRETNVGDKYIEAILQLVAVATNQPALAAISVAPQANDGLPFYDPLTVIVFERKSTDLVSVEVDKPYIVTHGRNKRILNTIGELTYGAYYYRPPTERTGDKIRVANDSEVKLCLKELTQAQLKTILTSDLFLAALAPMFEEPQVKVVENGKFDVSEAVTFVSTDHTRA